MKPPDELITPSKNDGLGGFTNITGKYRKCEDESCDNYVNCPWVRCPDHWDAMNNDLSRVHVFPKS